MTKYAFLSLSLIAATGLITSQAIAVPTNYKNRITPNITGNPRSKVQFPEVSTQKTIEHEINKRNGANSHKMPFQLSIGNIENNKMIPAQYSYCRATKRGKVKDGANISPSLQWTPAPPGTQSFAFIMVDKDVPVSFEKANLPNVVIEPDFKRQDFYHWVIIDIPANINGIMEGKDSDGLIKGGNPYGNRTYGIVGQNDYTKISEGPHGGYEGPCPPWNDTRMHHYHFTIYALDTPTLSLPDPVTGGQTMAAMQGHILAKSEIVGTYTTHIPLLKRLRKIKMLNAK